MASRISLLWSKSSPRQQDFIDLSLTAIDMISERNGSQYCILWDRNLPSSSVEAHFSGICYLKVSRIALVDEFPVKVVQILLATVPVLELFEVKLEWSHTLPEECGG
jgi:hypothetical protein